MMLRIRGNWRIKALGLVLASSVYTGRAQFDTGFGTPDSKAWSSFKLDPKTKVKLGFRNAGIDSIISFYQDVSGVTIVKDPNLAGQLTLTSATSVPLNQAFQILASTLDLKGFQLQKGEDLLLIRKKSAAPSGPPTGRGPGGDPPQGSVIRVYAIKHASAAEIARALNDVFGNLANLGFPGGGGRGNPGGRPQATARAAAENYSNSVIVSAPESTHSQVTTLLRDLDRVTDEPQQSRIFKLQYADAASLATTVQSLLTANTPRGRGGATATPQRGFPPFVQPSAAPSGAGSVTPETRTNALLVTATPANMALVEKLMPELDAPVEIESATFVFPLSNARATDVAQLISSAFGQRQGTRAPTAPATTRAPRAETPTELELATTESGELQTNVAAQGFQQPRQNTPTPQVSRDASGRVVNTRDLTGQVTTIADPNTNSIIVVTSPDNAEMIRHILDQLDKIPEQVMIETIIVEATLDASTKLGVEWQSVQNNVFKAPGNTGVAGTNFGGAADTQGFRYTLTGGALTGMIQALKTDQKFQVLSTPRIFTSNNVQAEINISQQVPYVLSSRTDASGNVTYNYSFEDVGIILTVTPRITKNGYVTMEVTQTANELQGFTSFNAPIVNQRQADTTVSVKDGETIILGGIIRNTVSSTVKKLPLLGDLPILGSLFRSSSKQDVKTELLVFLTPRVVRDAEEAKKLSDDAKKGMSPEVRRNLDLAGKGG